MNTKRLIVNRSKLHKKKTAELSNSEWQELQQYLVCGLYLLDQPRRNIYAGMKVVNTEADLDNKSRHNYLLNKNSSTKIFYINDQKSKSMPATQIITVSKELNSILIKWLRHNTTGHLLIKLNKKHKGLDTNRFEPMTKNYLTKYLNRLFAPTGSTNISSQMLRKYTTLRHMGQQWPVLMH